MKDLKYLCVQPDDSYYTWQVHLWLESLKKRGESDKAMCLYSFLITEKRIPNGSK